MGSNINFHRNCQPWFISAIAGPEMWGHFMLFSLHCPFTRWWEPQQRQSLIMSIIGQTWHGKFDLIETKPLRHKLGIITYLMFPHCFIFYKIWSTPWAGAGGFQAEETNIEEPTCQAHCSPCFQATPWRQLKSFELTSSSVEAVALVVAPDGGLVRDGRIWLMENMYSDWSSLISNNFELLRLRPNLMILSFLKTLFSKVDMFVFQRTCL